MIKKIISGGQTGVDRAALDAAIALNIPHGGWCPKGRLAEDGILPMQYALQETNSSEYGERTKLNIKDSDGTLILVMNTSIQLSPGTALTLEELKQKNKPYLIVDLSKKHDFHLFTNWIRENHIQTLNVAGPRESQCPGIYQQSLKFLKQVLGL